MAETGEESSRCSPHEPLIAPSRKCVCPKIRGVGSKAAVLVLFWAYIVFTSCSSITYLGETSNLIPLHIRPIAILCAIAIFLGPVAGLVASAYFGRYKVVYASLWFMWSGVMVVAIFLTMLQVLPETRYQWLYAGEVVGIAIYFFGATAFVVNSVPFGLDQMPDASSEQITAFVHWYVWSGLAGVAAAQLQYAVLYCVQPPSSTCTLQSLWSATLLTLALCSIFLLRRWLTIEPESRNPLKPIFKVLRFAAKHKVPVRRSAFTYWEPEIPSRIDLGKSKYGGPFTNEEVEDVKTCLRMLVVLSSISVAFCSVTAYGSSYNNGYPVMLSYTDTPCKHCLLQALLSFIFCLALSLPLHDAVIHPIVRKINITPSTLKRAGLALSLVVCVHLMALTVSVVWYKTESPDHCLLVSRDGLPPLSVYYEWIVVPNTSAIILSCFFFFTAMLEFVCAQAPYNLRGVLVGLLPSVAVLSALLGSAIQFIWKGVYKHQGSGDPMCGIWFYLFTTITAILGCVIWCVMAKWYKKREREEVDMCRIFAENYYDH